MTNLLAMFEAAGQRLFGPGSIFYWPYLLCALSISVLYLWRVRRLSLAEAVKGTFERRAWLGSTPLVDSIFCVIHFGVISVFAAMLATSVFNGLALVFDAWILQPRSAPAAFSIPLPVEMAIVTLIAALAHDFGAYVMHRLLHSVPVLWQIHSVHHSAESLSIFTAHRQHFLEPFILTIGTTTATVVALGTWYVFFPQRIGVYTFFGMGAIAFVMMHIVNLHHFHIPIRFPKWLRAFVVSPHIHHIHHSSADQHLYVNFGVIFSIWDRIFGTYLCEKVEPGDLKFGLHKTGDIYRNQYWRAQWLPLRMIAQSMFGRVAKAPDGEGVRHEVVISRNPECSQAAKVPRSPDQDKFISG